MRWFKHASDMRHKLESKLIRTQFGAEGYGIYCSLKEVVSEHIENSNIKEWGSVHPLHTIQTLADECGTNVPMLKKFLAFCDEKGILKKTNGKLFDPAIHQELDNFFERVKREKAKAVRS